MRALFTGLTILGTFVTVALFVYLPVVWLNLVFTFSDLPSSNIPYYDNASSSYNRYNSMWWIISTDVLRFIGPNIASYTINLILLQKQGYLAATTWYTIVMIMLVIVEAFKVAVFTWQFVYCGSYQLCRNFDPSGNPESANYVFLIMWIYSMSFLAIWVIYNVLVDTIKRYALLQLTETYTKGDEVPVLQLHVNHDYEDETEEEEYERPPLRSERRAPQRVSSRQSEEPRNQSRQDRKSSRR
jgi:hypothetical protein